jgi:hypothetical protein
MARAIDARGDAMKNQRKRDNAAIARVSESLDLPDYRARARHETSLHESAHIVCAIALGQQVEAVSLGTSGLGGGACWLQPQSRDLFSLRKLMVIIAAGAEADDQSMPVAGIGENSEDQNRLHSLATEIVGKIGTQKQIDREIIKAKSRAVKLVKQHRAEIELLAARLVSLYQVIDQVKPK